VRKGATSIDTAKKLVRFDSIPPVDDARRCYVKDQYPALVQNDHLRASDLRRLRDVASSFGYRPSISILLPVFDPEWAWLERGLDSVIDQVYPEWELHICVDGSIGEHAREVLDRYEHLDGRIKVTYPETTSVPALLNAALSPSRGEFVGLLEEGDELALDALLAVVKLLQEHPESDLVYSDMDEIDEKGSRSNPHFKPDWSPDLLLSHNYISSLSIYRRSLLDEIGGFREGFDGCQDYDLVLRATERTDEVHHVPKVLYHRRAVADPRASRNGDRSLIRNRTRRALSEALERRGLEGSVEDGYLPDRFRVRMKIKGEPRVSIIIPTRDNVSFLRRCIESVERLTTYRNYELLIIDNDSSDEETLEYLASIPHRVVPFREPFNYSKINNFAVSQAEGEYVLLLNDDTEVISGGWLHAMLEHAQRPEVGAVGAKLIYPDGRVQHAGVIVGAGSPWEAGVAVHSYHFYSSDSPGYAGTLATTTNYSAVTAACVLIRKSLYEELRGLDEENLRVQFNDIDLCLRMRERGYYIVYTPHAELYHYESVSRKHWRLDRTENLYMRERYGEVIDEDPYYNPNFSKGYGDFNLRADLLRPKVLRQEAEQTQDMPPSGVENLRKGNVFFLLKNWGKVIEWMGEHRSYMEARYKAIRSSPRTALIPRPMNGVARAPRQHRDESSVPIDHGTTDSVSTRPVRAEQLIWMFGHSRTGSTWLSWMMAELENQERWHEPYVGLLFGSFVYERLKNNQKLLNNPSFIMGEPYREAWLGSIRNFVLEGAAVRYPDFREDQYLVVKEPNGSVGAPLLLEATPESRMIFLIRDPRDVIASRLEAFGEGGWTGQDRDYSTTEKLNAQTKRLAEDYFRVVSKVQEAYEGHPGKKVLVRYEDLRHDTINTLKAMYDALKVEADEAQIEAAVVKHSWARVPEEEKGKDKFFRKAQPGSWREDLSSEQVKLIEDITDPILSKYY
jgi:O-antigen biosynthesis protein